jgi:hypothetical protein
LKKNKYIYILFYYASIKNNFFKKLYIILIKNIFKNISYHTFKHQLKLTVLKHSEFMLCNGLPFVLFIDLFTPWASICIPGFSFSLYPHLFTFLAPKSFSYFAFFVKLLFFFNLVLAGYAVMFYFLKFVWIHMFLSV